MFAPLPLSPSLSLLSVPVDDQIAALAALVRSELESNYVLHIFMSLCHQPEKQIPGVGALVLRCAETHLCESLT